MEAYYQLILLSTLCLSLVHPQDIECPVESPCECRFNDANNGDVIDCINRQLESIPAFIPSNHSWDTLYLNRNLISDIPDDAFAGITVEAIFLDTNLISDISDNAFRGIGDGLRILDLNYNRIITPSLIAIRDLPMLESLYMYDNLITELESEHLVGLTNLKVLDLTFNKMVEVKGDISANIPNLEDFILYGNEIRFIEDNAFSNFTQLLEIQLGINELPDIPTESFTGLTMLDYLSLWANSLTVIGPDDLITLPETVDQLILGNNDVSELPETLLMNLPNLRYVNLDYMLLETLPDSIFEISNSITQLNIEFNRFSSIPQAAIENLPLLNSFYMSGNVIETINGDEFASNPALDSIYLDFNQITVFNTSVFCNNEDLRILSLHGNSLTDFDACPALIHTSQFVDIALDGNPIHCGCDVLWMKQEGILLNVGNTICASPPQLAGIAVEDLEDEEFQCDLSWKEECMDACS